MGRIFAWITVRVFDTVRGMALPHSSQIHDLKLSLSEGRLTEVQSREVLAWLYEALRTLEQRAAN